MLDNTDEVSWFVMLYSLYSLYSILETFSVCRIASLYSVLSVGSAVSQLLHFQFAVLHQIYAICFSLAHFTGVVDQLCLWGGK